MNRYERYLHEKGKRLKVEPAVLSIEGQLGALEEAIKKLELRHFVDSNFVSRRTFWSNVIL